MMRTVAPPRMKKGDATGMITKIARRLEVPFGYRQARGGELRPYAFTQSIDGREEWQVAAKEAAKPVEELAIGDQVLCRGQLAVLTAFDPSTDECSITFRAEGTEIEKTVNFASRFGNGPKSARLQRPPALLLPPPRKERKDKISEEVKGHVTIVYETNCPTSPHTRDRMRRLRASRCWQEEQAMIQSETLKNLFNIFAKEYPQDQLSLTKFKMLKPWNLKKAYRETCLCRMCELFRLYVGGLHAAGDLTATRLHTSSTRCSTIIGASASRAGSSGLSLGTPTTRRISNPGKC